MANTKVTKAVLADDAVGLAQLDITNDPSDGQALTAANDGANNYNLTWASVGVSGISSSADANAIFITSAEKIGLGATHDLGANVHIKTADSGVSAVNGNADDLVIENADYTGISILGENETSIFFGDNEDSDVGRIEYFHSTNSMTFRTNASDAMTITNEGRVGIGTSSPSQHLTVHGSDNNNLIMSSNSGGNSNTMRIQANNAASYIVSSASVPLIFDVVNSERMRIDTSGNLLIGTTTSSSTSTETGLVLGDGFMTCRSSAQAGIFKRTSSNGIIFIFRNTVDTRVGTIETSSSSTSYNTSSDYRLKENVSYEWDATTRLKQLKPARFNWIEDETNTVVDGFLAHEVSDIVPEAISGEKDAVDEYGNPDYQGIDQSKLVPLLVKTIQELEARIETLESN